MIQFELSSNHPKLPRILYLCTRHMYDIRTIIHVRKQKYNNIENTYITIPHDLKFVHNESTVSKYKRLTVSNLCEANFASLNITDIDSLSKSSEFIRYQPGVFPISFFDRCSEFSSPAARSAFDRRAIYLRSERKSYYSSGRMREESARAFAQEYHKWR